MNMLMVLHWGEVNQQIVLGPPTAPLGGVLPSTGGLSVKPGGGTLRSGGKGIKGGSKSTLAPGGRTLG